MSSNIEVRSLQDSDLAACHALTQAERWPHRIDDWQFHHDVGEGWVALVDGRLVGVTMWWRYGDHLSTIGLVLVETAMQGRGIGGRLMSATMESADTDTRMLMSTAAGLKLYQNCGFKEIGRIGQVQGELNAQRSVVAAGDATLRQIHESDLDSLVAMDEVARGGNRRRVITRLLADGRGLVVERDGRHCGFAFIRSSGLGQTVGPVVAPDEDTAMILCSQLLSNERGFVRFDVDQSAEKFLAWLASIGLSGIDEVIIMTHGADRESSNESRIFGLVSQAIG